jgi:hypothetical protein
MAPYDEAWVNDALRRRPGLNPTLYSKKTAYQELVTGVRNALKEENLHNTDALYPQLAPETIKYIWTHIKNTYPLNKELQMSAVPTGVSSAVAVYTGLRGKATDYDIANPVYNWGGVAPTGGGLPGTYSKIHPNVTSYIPPPE